MRYYKLFLASFITVCIISCKKSTLVEYVDVPAKPIVAVKTDSINTKPSEVKAIEGNFKMIELPYEYKSLEPHFDAITMEIHFSKHHLSYVNGLNKAIVDTKYEFMTSYKEIFKNLNLFDAAVRNNAGGGYNHDFFWESMESNKGGEPKGELMEAIVRDFGSFDEFRNQFVSQANQFFASGWLWLISDKTGKLRITITANNDNPLMKNLGNGGIPLLNLDLWEHAYYLKFQNKKREYANTFFSIINWEKVLERYDAIPNKVFKREQAEVEVIEEEKTTVTTTKTPATTTTNTKEKESPKKVEKTIDKPVKPQTIINNTEKESAKKIEKTVEKQPVKTQKKDSVKI